MKSVSERLRQFRQPIQLDIATSEWVLQVLDAMGRWEDRCPIILVGIQGNNIFVIPKEMPRDMLEFIDDSYDRTFRIIPLVPKEPKLCATFNGMEHCPCLGILAISRDEPPSKKLRRNIEKIRREILRKYPERAEYIFGNSDVWRKEMILRESIYDADIRKRRKEMKNAQIFRNNLQK